jgi:CRISPR-associated protein Csb2
MIKPRFVAVFQLIGPVPLPFTATLTVCEKARAVFLNSAGSVFGKDHIPDYLSGHDSDGKPLSDSNKHVRFICFPDKDCSGIKYMAIYLDRNCNPLEEKAFVNMDDLTDFETRISWKLDLIALCSLSSLLPKLPEALERFFLPSTHWNSVTPFLKTKHLRIRRSEKHDRDAYCNALDREICSNASSELANHGFPHAEEIKLISTHQLEPFESSQFCSDFVRTRNTFYKTDMDYGHSLAITFREPVPGPFLIGKYSHFGMGLFGSF